MNDTTNQNEYSWVGSQKNYVDEINVLQINNVVLGRFGGNSAAGQYKNEDGCIVWCDKKVDWEFAALMDAHQTAESAELVTSTVESLKDEIKSVLALSTKEAIEGVSQLLLSTFSSQRFKEACQLVQGETACLFVVRKDNFLWWLSIGDCAVYVFHPELSALHEYQQNHRSFYEWIGKVNTFDLTIPCYSMGTKELRTGKNHVIMTTDGLLECPNTDFTDPAEIWKSFENQTNQQGVTKLLEEIKRKNVRDSTTIISWMKNIEAEASQPSDRS